jgi:hypothetical protein
MSGLSGIKPDKISIKDSKFWAGSRPVLLENEQEYSRNKYLF